MRRKYLQILTVLWMVAILWLSSVRQVPGGLDFPHLDKITHFAEFFILSILFFRTILFENTRINSAYKSMTYAGIYSVIIEFWQIFISWRTFTVYDIATNILGVLVGIYIIFNLTG